MIYKKFVVGPLDTNCYIIGSPEVIALIDPGFDANKIIKEINKLNPARLIVLLTHGHFEHWLNIDKIRDYFPDLTLMYHKAEYNPQQKKITPEVIEYLINNVKKYKKGKIKEGDEEYKKLYEIIKEYALFTNIKADEWLKEGKKIKLGEKTLITLETPGHSPGSLSFYSSDIKEVRGHLFDGVIFTGDLLLKRTVGEFRIPGGDEKLLFSSIKHKIMNNSELTNHFKILGGHYGDTTIAEEKLLNPFRAHF
ncbi:MAG: MBL fold metallo-hydrolase [Promethearchaeota archaeon]